MTISSPDHPVWSLLRLAIVNASVLLALWLTASNWDGETGVVLAALGATGAAEWWTRRQMKVAIEMDVTELRWKESMRRLLLDELDEPSEPDK